MDPISAMLIAAVFAKFFVKTSVTDLVAMATGREPPSHKYQMAKLEAAKTAGQILDPPKERGPVGTLVRHWIEDSCEDVDNWRRDRRKARPERKAAKVQRKKDRKAQLDEWLGRTAEEIDVPDQPELEEVDPWEPPVLDEVEWIDPPDSPEAKRVDSPDDTRDDIPAIVEPTQPETDSPEPTQPETDSPEPTQPETDSPEPTQPETDSPEARAEDTEWRPYGRPSDDRVVINPEIIQGTVETVEDQGAEVLPFPTVKEEETEMTAQTQAQGDGGGLNPHITWTGKMSVWETSAIGQAELVQAQMRAGGVGHVTQALIAHIQETHRIQTENYKKLAAMLIEQRRVQEAYNAGKNEAGDKKYLLTGQ